MRVYLLGYFYSGAWADDLIRLVTEELIREVIPDATILDKRNCPHPTMGVAEFFNREADAVVSVAGACWAG